MVGGKDTARAGPRGEVVQLATSVLALQALVTKADLGLAAHGRAAHGHAETLGKRRSGLETCGTRPGQDGEKEAGELPV
jgi:hypothetical protein